MHQYFVAFRKLPRVDAMTLPIGLPAGSLSPVEIGPNPKYRNWGKWKRASLIYYPKPIYISKVLGQSKELIVPHLIFIAVAFSVHHCGKYHII